MATEKDTIYIDIDDEITGIIDKVRSSDGKVVALVLPKRASVFQSIVNMKLLKRAASNANKNLVLITTEAGLLPLAGAAELHVASSLNSKPAIPNAPNAPSDAEETIDELDDEGNEITAETDGDTPVGELAGGAVAGSAVLKNDEVETIELDNESVEEEVAKPAVKASAAKKDKKLKVPNFERFRIWIILGCIALVLLIVGLIFAFKVLPKAIISIDTDATSVSIDEDVKLSTTAKSINFTNGTLPAKVVTQKKTYTQSSPATGQKNNGSKAEGEVVISAGPCSGDVPSNVTAGTGISAGGKTYIMQDSASFSPVVSGSKCTYKSDSVDIIAQSGGTSFNTDNSSFTVAGLGYSASGSATGGTDNIVTIVSEGDIAAAKAKINTADPTVKQALETDLKKENYYAIASTFSAGTPVSTTTAKAGDTASSVTVTEVVSYTMFGVQKSDLKELISNSAKEQIDTEKQSILDDGVNSAVFNVNSQNDKEATLSMHAEVSAGPQLDVAVIKADAAGKKSGEVKAKLQTSPDVTSVDIKLSPFWVNSVPKNTEKIIVEIAKPKPISSDKDAN